jgi:hypothetical protein
VIEQIHELEFNGARDRFGVPLARSSSRSGHGPLKAGTRVRIPYALPEDYPVYRVGDFPRKTASRTAWIATGSRRKIGQDKANGYGYLRDLIAFEQQEERAPADWWKDVARGERPLELR